MIRCCVRFAFCVGGGGRLSHVKKKSVPHSLSPKFKFSSLYHYGCLTYDIKQCTCAAWPFLSENTHISSRQPPLASRMAVYQTASKGTYNKTCTTESGANALSVCRIPYDNISHALTCGFDEVVCAFWFGPIGLDNLLTPKGPSLSTSTLSKLKREASGRPLPSHFVHPHSFRPCVHTLRALAPLPRRQRACVAGCACLLHKSSNPACLSVLTIIPHSFPQLSPPPTKHTATPSCSNVGPKPLGGGAPGPEEDHALHPAGGGAGQGHCPPGKFCFLSPRDDAGALALPPSHTDHDHSTLPLTYYRSPRPSPTTAGRTPWTKACCSGTPTTPRK